MKHLFRIFGCMLWTAGIVSFTACTDDDESLLDDKPLFDVTLDGESVLGSPTAREIEFGQSSRFDLLTAHVAYLEAIAPEGWNCAIILSDGYLTVAAPAYDDLDAETEGTITFRAYDAAGIGTEYTLAVEAFESAMTVAFEGEIARPEIFGPGKSKSYTYILSEKAERLSISAPEGWVCTDDGHTLTVTAPGLNAEEAVDEGTIAVAAVSPRGTKGETQRIYVALSRAVPTMIFEQTVYSLRYGETIDIPFTASEVARAAAENVPNGWNVAVDLDASKLVVTAPAKDAGATAGTVDIRLASVAEMEDTSAVTLRLYGIGSIDDFKALRDELDAETPDLAPYLIDGVPTLTADIAVGNADLIYAEGSAGSEPTAQALALVKAFSGGAFDGNGYTIDLSVDIDCRKFAIFYKVGSVGSSSAEKEDPLTKIHDLRLTGVIHSSYTTTGSSQGMLLAPLICYNNGAEIYNIESSVAITHERTDFGAETDAKLKQGIIGGLTATDQFGSPTYRNCRVTGAISTKGGIQNLGGITGYLPSASTNDYGTYTYENCEHTGAISVEQAASRHSDGYVGGIIGYSAQQQPVLTDCTNRGDFTIDLKGGVGSIQGCGGMIGSGYGRLTGCKNYGNITADESALNAAGTGVVNRRYGGMIGGAGTVSTSSHTEARNYRQYLENCTNYGNIKVSSSMVGGLIGISEKNYQEHGTLRNCVNEGTVESGAPVLDIGGLIGRSSGVDLYNCTNRGTVKGACSRGAAGLIGTVSWSKAGDTYCIDGCSSEGDILLSGNVAYNAAKGAVVQVSGFINTYFTTSVAYSITNSKVNCRIQADNADVNLFWGSYNGGKIDLYQADDYTQQNSKLLE